jgi:hypothetical protein
MRHPGQPGAGRRIEDELDAIAIHDSGGMHVDRQEQPFGINQDMPFPADEFLGAVITALAPTLVVCTDRLSTLPALGCGSRPNAFRSCSRKLVWIRSKVPSRRHFLR